MATILAAMSSSADATDFKCSKTFVTFQAVEKKLIGPIRLKNDPAPQEYETRLMVYTVRKTDIQIVSMVPSGEVFVALEKGTFGPLPGRVTLNRVEDWSQLIDWLD